MRSTASGPSSARRSRSPTTFSTSRAIPQTVGKATGKDAGAHKATTVSILGVERAKQKLFGLVAEAETTLAPFGARAGVLKAAARFVAERRA